jgi:signal transduction histidine kinase
VLFYGRDGGFSRDPDLGRAVIALAKRYAPMQQIHIAAEHVGTGGRYDVFLRLFWSDARRLKYFAILGFVVEPTRMREQLFGATRSARLEALLSRRGGDVPLQLRVTDENGAFVYGTPVPAAPGARVPLPMLFYPVNLVQSRLAARVEPRMWTIEVAAAEPNGAIAAFSGGYWPTALSVALMLVAVGLTVQAHRRSADLARMQTDFVAHVSHQLKTPLSLLSAATETLQMDRVRSPKKLAAYLDTIHAEAARLSALVQRVLEFSRVQEPRNYEFENVDLSALVRETVSAFARGLPSRHITFDMQHDGPGPFARADPAALEQVLANLLDNAAKYSDESRPIRVRLRAERGDAVVDVIDQGVGIAPADHARIFERFYRGSSTSQRPGFGLGLPIVRELIRAQGGRVSVASEPGEGSTFSVSVPRSERGRARLPATRVEPEQAAS